MNSNISVEMFRKIMDGEQFQTLNFAIEEHLSLIYAVYGGEQSVKENYPAVYDVIQSTRKKHLEGKELNHQTLLQLPEKERNIPTDYVYGAFWQQNSEKAIMAMVEGNFAGNCEVILSDMYIYDGGSLIKENHYQVTNSSELSYMVPIDPAKVPDISQLEGYMLCQWKKEGSDTMVSQTVNIRFLYESSLYGYVEETKLNDPVSKTGKDTVVVTYARTPSQIESVDYKYEEKLIGDHQELILDVSYDAVLKDVKYVGASPKNFYLIVHFETLGSAQYIVTDDFRDHYAECFTVDGNRVRFTLSNKYWGIPIEFPKLAYDSRTRLCGEVPFTVQGTKNENLFGEIAIVLQPDTFESDTWCKTYPLELVWGCLEGNMEVSMADGSRKKIKNIKVGDRVRCENGGQGTVTNVWSGQEEKDLMCLELSNGEKLICTESHPIATSNGYVMARTLTGMSELVSEAGESVKLTGMYPVTENEVYNLDVETDGAEGHFYASGVKVGDNKKQNDMGKIVKADNTLTQFQKEIVSLYSE